MTLAQIIFLGTVFLAVFTVMALILYQLAPQPLKKRLQQISNEGMPIAAEGQPAWVRRIEKLSGPFAKLSLPTEGWEASPLRIRFMNAGYRTPSAPVLFFAAKTILAFAFPAIVLLYAAATGFQTEGTKFVILLAVAAAFGYFLPNALLAQRIRLRQREIFENFPDALDLMTVCVEAGLGIDAAFAKVSEEMKLKSAALAEDLHLVNLQLRAGSTRERALRDLALRTGVEEIDSLVAMLVQSDRFGTSVADALRVHADSLRTKRRLRAEEAAAKLPVKLLFPLIFCIFPALLLVLLGPAYIRIFRVLFPVISGQ